MKLDPVTKFLQENINNRDIRLKAPGIPDHKSKIGGKPDWIQGDETPKHCGQKMMFHGQLDSIKGTDYSLGDSGMIYCFICNKCMESKSILQQY